jgi:hypothetical protein
MRLLRAVARLALLLVLSAVVLAVAGLGMEMNRQGLAAALEKRPMADARLLEPLSEAFAADPGLAGWLAIGMSVLLFCGSWLACHEMFRLRRLAYDREAYVRGGDNEKAVLASEVMRDLWFWLTVLAGPIALLAVVDVYLLSRYSETERVWLGLGIAFCAPLLFGYLSDRIVGTWQTLRGMLDELRTSGPITAAGASAPAADIAEASAAAGSGQLANQAHPVALDGAAPVRIDLSATEARVPVGADAEFRWTISGARAAVLRGDSRGGRFAVPMQGALLLAAPFEEERFELVATGLDGQEHRRELRVIPTAPSVDDPVDELKALAASWS